MKKKNYFAQIHNCDPEHHKARYFSTKEEAIEWISQQKAGGLVKKRNFTEKGMWGVVFECS